MYYPERTSSEAENVSDRELMDDAAEILQQKRMLEIVENRTGLDWKTVSQGLNIKMNAETGIISITLRLDNEQSSYECIEGLLVVIDSEVTEIIPVGDLIFLEEPELSDKPVANGWKTELAAESAVGCVCGNLVALLLRKFDEKKHIHCSDCR